MSENDEELAPMVDGLSGALCILVLVCTIFMISSLSGISILKNKNKYSESIYNEEKNVIYYNLSLNLKDDDKDKIKEKLSKMKKITIYGGVSDKIINHKEVNIYNMLSFYNLLKLPMDVKVELKPASNMSRCDGSMQCIYWE